MVISSCRVAMRDGVRLYTSVLRPQAKGVFPVVLIRNPYSVRGGTEETVDALLTGPLKTELADFIENGYCLVIQHCRGTGSSEGEHVHSLKECDDACDTLDWIHEQDFYAKEIYRFATHIASVPVAINLCCHADRHATIKILP